MSLPLSKYYDPEHDLPELVEELLVVDEHFTKDAPQSEHRRWEYALAIRALDTWIEAGHPSPGRIADVGGAGSPFWRMVGGGNVHVVDPETNRTLARQLEINPYMAQAVFCLSVLEHVDDLDQFLYHLSCLTAPGGLLFLTVDCCECDNQPDPARWHLSEHDPHHFASMRKRIFTKFGRIGMTENLLDLHFRILGEHNYTDYQPRLYGGATDPGYSFASLALVKRS